MPQDKSNATGKQLQHNASANKAMFLTRGHGKQEEGNARHKVYRLLCLENCSFVVSLRIFAGDSTLAMADFRSKRRIMPIVCLLSVLVKVIIT
jgi:hypothetical protein